jgi:ribosome-associated protein
MESKPSKSAKKREQLALQSLGERLVTLTDSQLAGMPLDEELRDAVLLARRLKSNGALRRQRQLIGKLMRRTDALPIHAALEAMGRQHGKDTRVLHEAEQWRDRIVQDGAAALAEFFVLSDRPNAELRRLCAELPRARSQASERSMRREIYRQIYADLTAKMQDTAR